MKKPAQVVIALILLLVGPLAESGVRVILGGGGLAEMLTIIEYRAVSKRLAAFKQEPLASQLTAEEQAVVNDILRNPRLSEIADTPIRFVPAQAATAIYEEGELRIRAEDLYDEGNAPRAQSEVAALAIEAWLASPLLGLGERGLPEGAIKGLADRLHLMATVRSHLHTIELDQPAARFQVVSLSSPVSEARLLLEFNEGAVDLTGKLIHALNCKSDGAVVIRGFVGLRRTGERLVGGVRWTCGGDRLKGQLVVSIGEDAAIGNVEEAIGLVVHSVRDEESSRPSGSSVETTCRGILK